MTTNVAVIGLAAMGLPMATRLAERFTVSGFDIAADRVALAADRVALAADGGVRAATSAADAVADAQAVLVAVRTGAQLNDLLFGESGLELSTWNTSPISLGSTQKTREDSFTVTFSTTPKQGTWFPRRRTCREMSAPSWRQPKLPQNTTTPTTKTLPR